jgi:hypothetical protein
MPANLNKFYGQSLVLLPKSLSLVINNVYMFRKLISFATIFSFGAILFPFASVHAQDTGLYLSPAQSTVAVGQKFTVKVWEKSGGADIDTIRVSIKFPAELLNVEQVIAGDVFPVSAGGNYFDNENGEINWGQGVYLGTKSDGVVFEIVFSALKAGTADVRMIAGTKMIGNGLDVPFATTDGVYTVVEGGSVSLPLPIDNVALLKKPTITNQFGFVEKARETQGMAVGQSSVPGAIVYILFDNGLFTGTVTANDQGAWTWRYPEDIKAGRYEVTIVAADPANLGNRVTQKTSILVAGEQSSVVPLQMSVAIGRTFEIIRACTQVDANILVSGASGRLKSGDQLIYDYKIYDSANAIILRQQETRVYDPDETDFWKSIVLPDGSPAGDYRFETVATYGAGKFVSADQSFYVCGSEDVGRLNPRVIGIIAASCAAAVIFAYLFWRWLKEMI